MPIIAAIQFLLKGGLVVEPVGIIIFLVMLLGLLVLASRRFFSRRSADPSAEVMPGPRSEDSSYKVSYAAPEFEWSGTTTGALPLKILTYKQYECLEDARYGFRIAAVAPSERKQPQPHKTRAHGQKTVASLVRHGFLNPDGEGGYVITDHGLNALEVCSVRY